MSADRSVRSITDAPKSPAEHPNVDWTAIDRTAQAQVADHRADQVASSVSGVPDRLDPGEPLDPTRERVAVAELQPDRLTRGTTDQDRALEAAIAEDRRPEHWIGLVNPGFVQDALAGNAGRTENCAECARSFQDALDGRPHVAAAIDESGLPCSDRESGSGEDVSYTEQWAGRRAESASWDDIDRLVHDSRGSAIVFAFGPDGGHAFNAYVDLSGQVRWADAQAGDTGLWPPEHLRSAFPSTSAIVFERGGFR